MKHLVVVSLFIFASLTSGCIVLPHPKTPEEFRQTVPGTYSGEIEEFEVKRSFSKVAGSFKKMAPKCLDRSVRNISTVYGQHGGRSFRIDHIYKPTVTVEKDKAEVYLQVHSDRGLELVSGEPPGGHYVMVVDAVPAGRKKTKVTIRSKPDFENVVLAFKQWAKGKTPCPDLTQ